MHIAPWRPGDETAIVDLFSTVFRQQMTPEFWRWRYNDHPSGPPLVILAWDGDRLAAHYAASHAPLLVMGQPVPAALSMTTMTHPDYRGQGLFERTAETLYAQLEEMGMSAVWGFPNRNSSVPFRKKLSWHAVADIPAMSRTLQPDERFPADLLTEVDRIDARFDSVKPPQAALRADHSHQILSWRIDRNPVNRYIRLVMGSAERLDGYAILKHYKDTDYDLVLMAANDPKAYPDLIAGALSQVRSLGGTRLSCWSLPQDETRLPLERAGFTATAPVTYFGGRVLRSIQPDFSDARGWRLSMIDSDLY